MDGAEDGPCMHAQFGKVKLKSKPGKIIVNEVDTPTMSSFCKHCATMLRGPRIVVGDYCCFRCRVKDWKRICIVKLFPNQKLKSSDDPAVDKMVRLSWWHGFITAIQYVAFLAAVVGVIGMMWSRM